MNPSGLPCKTTDTNIHVYNAEFGQHIGTSLAQMVAEELDLAWDDVSIDYPSMDVVTRDRMEIGQAVAWGSGIFRTFEKVRGNR